MRTSFGLLLSRLEHPDRFVRLISVQRISALLAGNTTSEYLEHFLAWLRTRELEMDAVLGISILASVSDFVELEPSRISAAVSCPSILSNMLLEEFFGYRAALSGWENRNSGFAPMSYKVASKFEEKCGQAGPILFHQFRDIEDKSGFPMLKQWAWELESLERKGCQTFFEGTYFREVGTSDSPGCFEPRAAEVVRSAFLRVISLAISDGMPEGLGRYLATHCVPLLPDLARIEFGQSPVGWGKNGALTQEQLDSFLGQCSKDQEWVVVAADGRWSSTILQSTKLELRSALIGKEFNTPAEYAWQQVDPSETSAVSGGQFSISGTSPVSKLWNRLEDQNIMPLATRFCPKTIPRLQLDLIFNSLFWPLCISYEDVTARCDDDGLKFSVSSSVIGRWRYWVNDWDPDYPDEIGPKLGTMLEVKREILDACEMKTGKQVVIFGRGLSVSREREYSEFNVDPTLWAHTIFE